MLAMLSDLKLNDKIQYGTKASSLGELMANRVEVPKGFVLAFEFFIEFLEYNKFSYSSQDYLAYNEEICNFILNGQFSPEMETSLHGFFNNIQNKGVEGKFAVRSSALCEDSEIYSMAGMFSSFINLDSFEEVKSSIKKCYASLFSDKVIAYFASNKLSFEELKMCVIVQQFVEGEYSGVNFSVDTIDMNEDIMYINAVNGICDDYVSGKASSAFYKINKKTGEIIEEAIPEKLSAMPGSIVDKLYESTLRIEKIFGRYQDIEWTVRNNKIYILQARPVTTFKIKNFEPLWENEDEDNYTWYRECDKPYEPLINELSIIQGEALNEGFYATGFQDYYTEYCVQNGYLYYRDKEMADSREQNQNFLNRIDKLSKKYKNIFQDVALPEILHAKNDLDNYISRKISPQETLSFLEKSIKYMKFLSANHWPIAHGCDYLDTFMEYCKSINEDLDVDDFYDLVFNVSILNKERELYVRMASEIKSNPVLDKMFKACQYNEILYVRLKKIQESENLMKLIDEYTATFGVCNLNSEVNNAYYEPLLMEAPSKIIGHIRGFLNTNIKDFKTSVENSLKNKNRIKSDILSTLAAEKREDFFNKLDLAEKAYLARDNHHYYFERMTKSYLRLALVEAERILMNNQQIQNKEDIYFLTLDEIKEGLLSKRDYRKIINNRKQLYNYQKKLFAPTTIGKEPNEENEQIQNNSGEHAVILKGLSGLRKKVRAKAKIGIPDYLDEDTILVVPFTRCGELEPVVNYVRGIIVEVGSPFEHLGILAREMNIPVIYNVKNAMSILKDGDEVELNGFTGEIKIVNSFS